MNTSGAVYQTWQHSSFTKSFTNRITTSSPHEMHSMCRNLLSVYKKNHVPQSRWRGKHNTLTVCPCNQYHKRNETQQGSRTSLPATNAAFYWARKFLIFLEVGTRNSKWETRNCNQIEFLISKEWQKNTLTCMPKTRPVWPNLLVRIAHRKMWA